MSQGVFDHYDLAIRPVASPVKVLKILQRGELDYELNEGGFNIGVLVLILAIIVLLIVVCVIFKKVKKGEEMDKKFDEAGAMNEL